MMLAPEDYAADAADKVFPPFDPTYFASQLFWLAITFGVLYFALSRFVLPKIGSAIEERRDRIADDLDAAADAKAEADAAGETYEKSLADARAKAHVIAADTRAALDKEIAADTAEVEAELAAKQEAAEAAISKAKKKALDQVEGIASKAAVEIASTLAGLDVAEADATKAVAAAAKEG